MSLNRNVTRVVINSTEYTDKARSINTEAIPFALLTTDALYLGYQGPFAARHFHIKTANTNPASVTVEQWTGSAWESAEDVIDQTLGFTQDGFISWVNLGKWRESTQAPVSDLELYWVRIKVSANLSAGTEVQSIENIFSNDDLLRQYYPEIVTDSRFKPIDASGNQSDNFLEQHRAAKDLVVLRLKQRRMIDFESQVIDINAVSIAAAHACAWVILNPIATSDATRELADRAKKNFDDEISQVNFSIDNNEDGVISEGERRSISAPSVVRR